MSRAGAENAQPGPRRSEVTPDDLRVLAALRTALGKAAVALSDASNMATDKRKILGASVLEETEAGEKAIERALNELERAWPL